MTVDEYAHILDDAARRVYEIDQFDADNLLSLDDAYAIQAKSIALRVQRGESRVGVKMGFTSRAKMVQMGLTDVIWGRLTSGMLIEDGGTMTTSRFIHPRAEPELAFLLKRELPSGVTGPQVSAAVEAIAPAIELIDSRYRDFKFTLPEVIADNASSSGFIVGAWHSPSVDFSNLGMALKVDGKVVQVGSTAALLGNPLRSLVAAARLSALAGEPLQPGWIVMAGSATAAEWIKAGNYISADVQGLGSVGFHVN